MQRKIDKEDQKQKAILNEFIYLYLKKYLKKGDIFSVSFGSGKEYYKVCRLCKQYVICRRVFEKNQSYPFCHSFNYTQLWQFDLQLPAKIEGFDL